MSPKARQSKGKARVTSYEQLLGQEAEKRREDLEIYIPPGPRLGDLVFEFDKVTKSFDDRLILDGFSASVLPGSIVGIIGPNGAGKTTLLRMITGTEKPDSLAISRPVALNPLREVSTRKMEIFEGESITSCT